MSSTVEITALTIEEAAPHLKIAPKTLRKWLREGEFPGVKLGRKWLVRATDIEHALATGRRGDHAVWVPDADASPEMPPPEAQAPTPLQPPVPPADQRKSALLARLRALYAEGHSMQAIANQLNRERVPTLSGKGRWQKGTVGNLLTQEG